MKTTVRRMDSVTVIDLVGRITIGKGDIVLRETFNDVVQGGERRILINLSGVSYMDSCGLGELVSCCRIARERDVAVKLLNPSGRVFDLLQMIKLEEMVDSFKEERTAMQSFAPGPAALRAG